MSSRHAFMRRDWFTCSQCARFKPDEHGRPACQFGPIRWDPKGFGCGEYCAGNGPVAYTRPLEAYL